MSNLESRLRTLEDSTGKGYTTVDPAGRPVIDSNLDAMRWFQWATALLARPGCDEEKKLPRDQLARSSGKDGDGGHLYELVEAMYCGPVEGS
jgi:hypothetical protein